MRGGTMIRNLLFVLYLLVCFASVLTFVVSLFLFFFGIDTREIVSLSFGLAMLTSLGLLRRADNLTARMK
jgi:hypothetical protein